MSKEQAIKSQNILITMAAFLVHLDNEIKMKICNLEEDSPYKGNQEGP